MTGLRVAHVVRKYDPAQWGGTETHVAAVTQRLGRHGWSAEVHAPAGPLAPDHALAPEVALQRYRAFCPFIGSQERLRGLYANAGNIASFDEPIRLIRDRGLSLSHVHTLGRIGGGVRTAMRLTGRAYVVSLHGPVAAERELIAARTARWLEGTWDLGRPIGLLLGSRRVLDDAARVITFNDAEREAIAARVGDRAVRMDHGVDLERLSAGDAARARARWPELGAAKVVALVGRIDAQKNQLLAVRAFARGAPEDYHLALPGAETEPGYRAKVEREALALGVRGRVHFLGNLDPFTEIPDLFARATLVIVPSTNESFGLAVLEGWAAGRPVLFARRTGLVDLARALGDDTVAVPTLDERDWAGQMRRLLTSADALRAAGAIGNRLVCSRFRWSVVVEKLVELYREVLRERRGRGAG